MKRLRIGLVYLLLIVIAGTQTGCFGTFSLTRKVWAFNKSFTDKILQEAIFLIFCIIPVYEVCTVADVIVFNLIEFWSGTNPVAMKPGEVETKIMAFKGITYKVTAMHNKFIIEQKKDNNFFMLGSLEYKNKAWYSNTNKREHKLIGYNAKGQVEVYSKDNKVYTMDKNLASSEYLKKMVNTASFAKR
jgi:hypothetical protein